MTLRRYLSKERSTDELDRLIWWTLRSGADRGQPSAYVWKEIERKVRRRMASKARWYVYDGGRNLCQPVPVDVLCVWASRVPLSLVCLVEHQMPIMRLG